MEQSKFYQIKNITEQEYTLVGCDGSVITRPIQDVDKSASAFTIQDAKDGDVLATSAGAFIYNGNNGGGSCPGSYCGINTLGGFETGVKHHWTVKKVYPATQEQRDTLIKAMTDAGYTFDFEKKELKKTEQKPTEWSEENKYLCTQIEGILQECWIKNLVHFDLYKKMRNFIKSLRSQNTWKPSDEQIEILDMVLTNESTDDNVARILRELREQLKKL